MELHALKVFLTVANEKSFSRAGEKLLRTQPAVSLAIQRLERDSLIDGDWQPTENNRRAKYYSLTQKGRTRLNEETREWSRQVAAIARILEAQ